MAGAAPFPRRLGESAALIPAPLRREASSCTASGPRYSVRCLSQNWATHELHFTATDQSRSRVEATGLSAFGLTRAKAPRAINPATLTIALAVDQQSDRPNSRDRSRRAAGFAASWCR